MLQTVLRQHMDNANPRNRHFLLKRAMPVVEDSDNDSSISNEDSANLLEVANGSSDDQVKLGLRNAIRSRRVAKGLEEVPNPDPKKPRIEQLTPEEEEKRRLRRERNKLAAFKCRQRRKEHIQNLEQESDGLEEENETLENEIAALKAQKEQLEEMFKKHICRLDVKNDGCPAASPETCSAEAAKDEGALNPQSPTSMFQSKA